MHRLLLPMALTGCTWIFDTDIEKARDRVDDDGDGHVKSVDCNDLDPNIYPDAPDVWYDGVDSNCGGDNDYDADKDGFVPREYANLPTTGVIEAEPLPAGDCWDDPTPPESPSGAIPFQLSSSDIHPDAETDAHYDGVDQNCDGSDDFDADKDGYVPDEYVGLPTVNVDSDELLPGGDCDDTTAEINPQATDTWYDGVDSNCDELDDYDADQDGHRHDDIPNIVGDDCNDQDPLINPTIIETFYNGIDENCAEDNDFDQDKDGYVPEEYSGIAGLPGGDCDDLDAQAYPGAVEILNDSRDLDCDTLFDSFYLTPIEFTDFPLIQAEPEKTEYLTAAANATEVAFAFIQDQDVNAPGQDAKPVSIRFDLSTMEVTQKDTWSSTTPGFNHTKGLAITMTNQHFIGVYGEISTSDRSLRVSVRDSSGVITHRKYFLQDSAPAFDDVDVLHDTNGDVHAIGCNSTDGVLQYLKNPISNFLSTPEVEVKATVANKPMSSCRFRYDSTPQGNAANAKVVGLNNGGLVSYEYLLNYNPTLGPDLIEDTAFGSDILNAANNNILDPSTNQPFLNLGNGDLTEVLILDNTGNQPLVFVDNTAIYMIADNVPYLLRDGIQPESVKAQLATPEKVVLGYIDALTGEPAIFVGDLNAFVGGVNTTLPEYKVSTDFVVTEIQPWLVPSENELIVVVLGNNDMAYAHAQLD